MLQLQWDVAFIAFSVQSICLVLFHLCSGLGSAAVCVVKDKGGTRQKREKKKEKVRGRERRGEML